MLNCWQGQVVILNLHYDILLIRIMAHWRLLNLYVWRWRRSVRLVTMINYLSPTLRVLVLRWQTPASHRERIRSGEERGGNSAVLSGIILLPTSTHLSDLGWIEKFNWLTVSVLKVFSYFYSIRQCRDFHSADPQWCVISKKSKDKCIVNITFRNTFILEH